MTKPMIKNAHRPLRLTLDEAASRLANVVEKRLAQLSPADRKKKWAAFCRVVDRVSARRAKSESPPQTPASRLQGRARG